MWGAAGVPQLRRRPADAGQVNHRDGAGTSPAALPPRVVASVLVLLALGVAVGTGVVASRLDASAQSDLARARWAQLVGVVHRAETALLDELNAMAGAALSDPLAARPAGPAVRAAAARRASAFAELQRTLDRAVQDWPDPRPVTLLQDALGDVSIDAADHPEMADVLDTGQLAVASLTAAATEPEDLALLQLASQAVIPRYVANDLLDATFLLGDHRVAGWAVEYYRDAGPYLGGGDGGWLDGDASAPMVSPYLDAPDLRRVMPEVWTELRSAVDRRPADNLLQLDTWIRGWPAAAAEPPPVSLPVGLRDAGTVASAADAVVTGTLQRSAAARQAQASHASLLRLVVVVVGVVAVLAMLSILAVVVLRDHRRVLAWRAAALHDPLTGLPNRRALVDHVAGLEPRPGRGDALLLFDLDHFKAINDAHGHEGGDHALVAVAERATAAARALAPDALVARLGGDEFVVYLHGLRDPAGDAGRVAQGLIDLMGAAPLEMGDTPVLLQASVGIATTQQRPDLSRLLREADSALYEVKRTGRGRHGTFHDTPAGTARTVDLQR